MSSAAREGSPSLRVALDAMGGDHAPATTVAGALRARAEGIPVLLVGDARRLRDELGGAAGDVEVVHAAEVIAMDEDPAIALRSKRDASIRVAAGLVADGRAGALVSAGSTGATLAASLLVIGRLPGVRRPVVAAVLPAPAAGDGAPAAPGTVLLDAGASAEVQPEALAAYGHMGAAYARVRGVTAPRVGLLNVGAEPGKGSAFAKAAFAALEEVPGFCGNVEPAGVLAGAVDVVVSDGFTGNIFLKTVEALAGTRARADVPGAAVLLGCAHPVLVAHGDAGAGEIAAALRTAHAIAAARLTEDLGRALQPGSRRQERAGG